MEMRIVNKKLKYPPLKLIEPTTLGYIRRAAVVQQRRRGNRAPLLTCHVV
jgi:hypothetical protein